MIEDSILIYSINISEKILITFTLFYFICNILFSFVNFWWFTTYLFTVGVFYYLLCLRRIESEELDEYDEEMNQEMAEVDCPVDDFDYEHLHYKMSGNSSKIALIPDEDCNENLFAQCGFQPERPTNFEAYNHVELSSDCSDLDRMPFHSSIRSDDPWHDRPSEYHINYSEVENDYFIQNNTALSRENPFTNSVPFKSLCQACTSLQSIFTVHCTLCSRCATGFHHCSFLNTCVTESNKNEYLFFMLFSIIACFRSQNALNYMIGSIMFVLLMMHLAKRLRRLQKRSLINDEMQAIDRVTEISDEQSVIRRPDPVRKNAFSDRKAWIMFIREIEKVQWKYVFTPWMRREIRIVR